MALSIPYLKELGEKLSVELQQATDREGLERLRRDWLAKEGTLRQLFKELKGVPEGEKASVAAELNRLRDRAEEFVARREKELELAAQAAALAAQNFDLSLPGFTAGVGREHPITAVERMITGILEPFGFRVAYGPEIETEYYCFDSLNIPPHHPARDMQDTFFTQDLGGVRHLLRTHTTSVQARTLEKGEMPVKIASLGRVYRNEAEDASHTAMFHQYELVWIEEGLTLAHLQGLIIHILRSIYGARRKVRFIPKYYPYTEPSIGPQLDCVLCRAAGCPACGGAGWVTIGGAGMVHRRVLEEFKYDPEKVSGFAFGLGSSRLAGQLFHFPKLKMVYDNDLRVLSSLTASRV